MSLRVLLYGLSGSGKSTAARILEDIGFRVVRNLSPSLIQESFQDVGQRHGDQASVAIFPEINSESDVDLIPKDEGITEVFLEASDETLLNRYKESRRPHPFEVGTGILEAMHNERALLKSLRDRAHHIIETSKLKPAELNNTLVSKLGTNLHRKLVVTFLSFGFKYGVPPEIDLCFDVRFLPNPYFIDGLRDKAGTDSPVENFVMDKHDTRVFMDKFDDFFSFLLPCYEREGKNYLTVGIGCTGGRHRSVAIANALSKRCMASNVKVLCVHRDIDRPVSLQ